MTPSPTEVRKTNTRIAFLVACASVLQILESLIPIPVPGVRLGLANMVTLVALVDLGFGAAVEIAVLRTVCSSFILGTFFSPAFIISFVAALLSTLVMGALFHRAAGRGRAGLSLLGISVLGALAHNCAQLGVVYLLFIRHPGVFLLLPWLALAAVAMGWITGVVASQVCLRLQAGGAAPGAAPLQADFLAAPAAARPGSRPELKLGLVFLLALVIVLWQNFTLYLCVFVLVLGMLAGARVSLADISLGLRRVSAFLVLAFLIPALFGKPGEPGVGLGPLLVTRAGLLAGGLYASRLVLFILATTWLMKTSPPAELTAGLKKILSPLKRLGWSLDQGADIVGLAYALTPAFLEKARAYLRSHDLLKPAAWKQLVPNLAAMVAALYRQAEESAA